jgi:hypothetical protein
MTLTREAMTKTYEPYNGRDAEYGWMIIFWNAATCRWVNYGHTGDSREAAIEYSKQLESKGLKTRLEWERCFKEHSLPILSRFETDK